MKSQPICGPLGPNFGGFCANNTTKTKVGVVSQRPNVPLFVFVPLLAQEPSNLGPKEAELPLRLTYLGYFPINHNVNLHLSYGRMVENPRVKIGP